MRRVIIGMLNKQIAADLGIAEKTVKYPPRADDDDETGVASVPDLMRLVDAARQYFSSPSETLDSMNPAGEPPLTGTASRRTTKDSLSSTLRLQRLLTEISSDFVTRPETETGEIIESAQRMICEALGMDCSTLWLFP